MLILDTSALQMQMNGMIIVAFFITCSTEVLVYLVFAYSIASGSVSLSEFNKLL